MEYVSSEFRKKLENLINKFKDIFERNRKLKNFTVTFMLMNQYNLLHKD